MAGQRLAIRVREVVDPERINDRERGQV